MESVLILTNIAMWFLGAFVMYCFCAVIEGATRLSHFNPFIGDAKKPLTLLGCVIAWPAVAAWMIVLFLYDLAVD